MRRKSHICLGRFLVKKYMEETPGLLVWAFILGCVEPDHNPATYLKGSRKYQWLRGHHFPNSLCYMGKLAAKLEGKAKLSLLDYYTAGKLIHYAADCFTAAHNEAFPPGLTLHRNYESDLQAYFLHYISLPPEVPERHCIPIMELLHQRHQDYLALPVSVQTDSRYAVSVCCDIISALMPPLCPTVFQYATNK